VIQTKRQNKRLEEIGAGGGRRGQRARGRLGRGGYANGYSLYFSYSLPKSLHELQLCISYKVAITACTIQCNMPCTTCHGFRLWLDDIASSGIRPRHRFRRSRVSRDDAISMNRFREQIIRSLVSRRTRARFAPSFLKKVDNLSNEPNKFSRAETITERFQRSALFYGLYSEKRFERSTSCLSLIVDNDFNFDRETRERWHATAGCIRYSRRVRNYF